jgi:sec-independent protein translocase protein TatA
MFASPWKDSLIILVILLLFFGPKRLPALSRSIGESIKEFKGGIAQSSESDEKSEISATAGSDKKSETSETAPEAQATNATSEHTSA